MGVYESIIHIDIIFGVYCMVFQFVNDSPRMGNDDNGCFCIFPTLGNLAADRIHAFPGEERVPTVEFILSHPGKCCGRLN